MLLISLISDGIVFQLLSYILFKSACKCWGSLRLDVGGKKIKLKAELSVKFHFISYNNFSIRVGGRLLKAEKK